MDAETVSRLRALRAAKIAEASCEFEGASSTSHCTVDEHKVGIKSPVPTSSPSTTDSNNSGSTSAASQSATLGPAAEALSLRQAQHGDIEPKRRSFRREEPDGYLDMDSVMSSLSDQPIGESNRGFYCYYTSFALYSSQT